MNVTTFRTETFRPPHDDEQATVLEVANVFHVREALDAFMMAKANGKTVKVGTIARAEVNDKHRRAYNRERVSFHFPATIAYDDDYEMHGGLVLDVERGEDGYEVRHLGIHT